MGIVECVDGDVIYTKEGNTSDSYVERTYAVGGMRCIGLEFDACDEYGQAGTARYTLTVPHLVS